MITIQQVRPDYQWALFDEDGDRLYVGGKKVRTYRDRAAAEQRAHELIKTGA